MSKCGNDKCQAEVWEWDTMCVYCSQLWPSKPENRGGRLNRNSKDTNDVRQSDRPNEVSLAEYLLLDTSLVEKENLPEAQTPPPPSPQAETPCLILPSPPELIWQTLDFYLNGKDWDRNPNDGSTPSKSIMKNKNKPAKIKYPKCLNCGRELKPALDCLNFVTGEWDEHSFRCPCFPKNVILSIGQLSTLYPTYPQFLLVCLKMMSVL